MRKNNHNVSGERNITIAMHLCVNHVNTYLIFTTLPSRPLLSFHLRDLLSIAVLNTNHYPFTCNFEQTYKAFICRYNIRGRNLKQCGFTRNDDHHVRDHTIF